VHLKHVSGHGCRGGKLAIAPIAREMTILLMLEQDVGIVELLVTVVAEGLQHGNSTTLSSHFYYYYNIADSMGFWGFGDNICICIYIYIYIYITYVCMIYIISMPIHFLVCM
jgi:hypothetical protein